MRDPLRSIDRASASDAYDQVRAVFKRLRDACLCVRERRIRLCAAEKGTGDARFFKRGGDAVEKTAFDDAFPAKNEQRALSVFNGEFSRLVFSILAEFDFRRSVIPEILHFASFLLNSIR